MNEARNDKQAARPWAALLTGALAVGCILVGITGIWAQRTVADSDWVDTVAVETLRQPQVNEALARVVVTDFEQAVGGADLVADAMPQLYDRTAPLIWSGLRARIEQMVGEQIGTDPLIDTVAASAATAHSAVVNLIDGDGSTALVTEEGIVRVNLLPVVPHIVEAGHALGLFDDLTAPDVDPTDTVASQLESLSAAFGTELPPNFAQPIVYDDDAFGELAGPVDTARQIINFARGAGCVLLFAGVVLAAASAWLAQRRVTAGMYLIAGYLFGVVMLRMVVTSASDEIPELFNAPAARIAVTDLAAAAMSSFFGSLASVAAIGGIIVGLSAAVRAGASSHRLPGTTTSPN